MLNITFLISPDEIDDLPLKDNTNQKNDKVKQSNKRCEEKKRKLQDEEENEEEKTEEEEKPTKNNNNKENERQSSNRTTKKPKIDKKETKDSIQIKKESSKLNDKNFFKNNNKENEIIDEDDYNEAPQQITNKVQTTQLKIIDFKNVLKDKSVALTGSLSVVRVEAIKIIEEWQIFFFFNF